MRSLVVYNNKYVNFSSWRSKKGKNPGGGGTSMSRRNRYTKCVSLPYCWLGCLVQQ